MASDTDVPRPGFRSRITGRAVLIALGVLLFVVVVFGRAIASFYVRALWHDALGRSDVFWGQIWARVTLFVMFLLIFLVIAFVNLWFADRAAPTEFPANVHPYVERFHEVFGHRLRLLRYGTASVLALMLALPAASRWQEWLLFRNSKSFPDSDPQFGVNVGFYVFELPFLTFAIDWLFAALVIVLILTIAAHLLNGGVLFTSATPTVRSSTKVHIAVLLAILAAVRAGDYWLSRYELTNDTRGFVQGATYTVVNAQIPALMLLVLIALTTSVLFLSTIRFDRWRLPIIASGLWLVVLIGGAVIYPAVVQSLVVQPNQEERESVYIARNVEATRAAMGIADVETVPIEFERLTATDVESDLEPIRNVRLLNPTQMLPRFSFDRGEVAGLKIDDLDVDRYELDGDMEQVLITARELDLNNIPNKSWQGEHLVSTRGCGLVLASASQVTEADRPDYRTPELERPQLYFSPSIGGYAIVGTEVSETPCGDGGAYDGDAGVEMSSILRRGVFALAFLDYNILGSGAIESDSQILWNRSVEDRLETLAPFLDYDGDPYPVAVDGEVKWVVDAYTSTTRYPYAQRIGDVQLSRRTGLSSSDNYVRNSVKAVVDAYTGGVTFYAIDDEDPILRAWSSAFPDLFTPGDEMPDELRSHLRYPEDLFRVQTDLYSKYQIAPEDFFQRIGAWSVAQAPSVDRRDTTTTAIASDPTDVQTEFATESDAERFIPYYTLFRDEASGEEEFVILRPFVPFSTDDRRTELQAYMTASSDPDTYGEMTTYVVEQEPLPAGPLRVADQAESDSDISPELSLLANDETGTQVKFGDMQPIPVADGLVYVRPVYVVSSDVTEFRLVIVSHNDRSVMEETLDAALTRLFPGYEGDVGERIPDPDEVDDADGTADADGSGTTDPDEATDPDDPSTGDEPSLITGDAAELVRQAETLYNEAQELLRDGDLGGYQDKIDEMGEILAAIAAELDA